MIRQRPWFPVVYMFVLMMCFSSLVIGLSRFSEKRVAMNEALAFEGAVLSVFPGLYDGPASGVSLHQVFVDNVTGPDESTGGAYTWRQAGQIVSYAVPISGQGFWAPIRGIIGVKADRKTITGIAFYEQSETPGLGAEITKEPFRKQFEGKVIAGGDVPIRISRPGAVLGESEVHAVTGATQTSSRLEKIIHMDLKKWGQALRGSANEKQVLR